MRPDIHKLDLTKTYFITGTAGFIGYHLARMLLDQGAKVIGYDNINDYYDITLKYDRLHILEKYNTFTFIKGDLVDGPKIDQLFHKLKPHIVVHLAAQAGVRYSIEKPERYMDSNMIGFFSILEACRYHKVEHLVFASSSSVYGGNKKVPFSTSDKTDAPVSFYAATKKANEIMAYSYSHLYGIPTTGLRFFTVYGPFGRPDMAYFTFTKAIMEGVPIKIYNKGDMYRDFTYIDDIVKGIGLILGNPPVEDENNAKFKIYNLGNNNPIKLLDYIEILEKCIGKKAIKEYLPMQSGDVYQTYADISDLEEDFSFQPSTPIEIGLKRFVDWYQSRYHQ